MHTEAWYFVISIKNDTSADALQPICIRGKSSITDAEDIYGSVHHLHTKDLIINP